MLGVAVGRVDLAKAVILSGGQIQFSRRPAVITCVEQPVAPSRHTPVEMRAVAIRAYGGRKHARHEARPGGHANRAAAISVAEIDALRGKAIQIGRADDGVAVRPHYQSAMLVGADEENIGFLSRRFLWVERRSRDQRRSDPGNKRLVELPAGNIGHAKPPLMETG